jgi:hypothetical protein
MRMLRFSLFLALAMVVTATVGAQAQASPFQGTFALDAAQSDNVDQAIGQATSRMNFALRQVARPRLRRTNQPYQRVAINLTGSQVSIATDSRAPIVTATNGTPIKWTREDREVFDVSTTLQGNRLRQVFAAEDGRRENVFTLSPDGNTLTMNVTVSSGRLPEPLTYKLVFRRAS